MSFEYKTTPFTHQLTEFELSRDHEQRALWWEMGVAKTKPMLDTAAWLASEGKIDGLLVVAPNGVHRNWVTDEIPAHLQDSLVDRSNILSWRSDKAGTKWHQEEVRNLHAHRGFGILAMNYSGLMTKAGHACTKKFLTGRRCLYVLDESHWAKSPGTKRTKRVLASSRYAPYRRVLTGTPITNSPFDVYAQIKFLDPMAWVSLGISNFAVFKSFFGVWITRVLQVESKTKEFPQLVEYKNLDILNKVVAKYGSRLLKSEVLDLPPKLYQKRYFDMSPNQWRIYKELKKEYMAWLDSGETVTAPLALTRILRFQQITSGYLPADLDDKLTAIDGVNTRLKELAVLLAEVPNKAIIWAKYTNDIDMIVELCRLKKYTFVRYDGQTSTEDRDKAKQEFQKGDAQFFIANADCAGTGLTLHAAKTEIFYNTTYKMGPRLQAEDRAHRAGMNSNPLIIIDMAASGTIDEIIIGALRRKKSLSDIVMGDPKKAWV